MKKAIALAVLISVLLVITNASSDQGYVIGEEDVLQVSIWGNPELTVTVPVKPDGTISMHLVGDVKAEGLTPQQLKAFLEIELSRYFKAPNVSVIVSSVNSFKVFVFGNGVFMQPAVGSDGPAAMRSASEDVSGNHFVFTFKRATTLMQLLAYLGSLKNADLNNCYILREGKKLDCDFWKLVEKGDLSQDIQLKPNDTVFIPDNFAKRIIVLGAVKKPDVLQYREGMTVLDAIVGAGGFTDDASQNSVVVARKEGGKLIKIRVHLKDLGNNIQAMPGDQITVQTSIF